MKGEAFSFESRLHMKRIYSGLVWKRNASVYADYRRSHHFDCCWLVAACQPASSLLITIKWPVLNRQSLTAFELTSTPSDALGSPAPNCCAQPWTLLIQSVFCTSYKFHPRSPPERSDARSFSVKVRRRRSGKCIGPESAFKPIVSDLFHIGISARETV
jgi:hypothetical protein